MRMLEQLVCLADKLSLTTHPSVVTFVVSVTTLSLPQGEITPMETLLREEF